jgi:hypothetical protein
MKVANPFDLTDRSFMVLTDARIPGFGLFYPRVLPGSEQDFKMRLGQLTIDQVSGPMIIVFFGCRKAQCQAWVVT